MVMSDLLNLFYENFTPILAGMTILSFIGNIIQYLKKKSIRHSLDSMYHSIQRTIRINSDQGKEYYREMNNYEFIHILYDLRYVNVSILRSLGVKREFGQFEAPDVRSFSFLYRFCRLNYLTIIKIKEKWPKLVTDKRVSNLE